MKPGFRGCLTTLVTAVGALGIAACGKSDSGTERPLQVYAAASLTDVLEPLAEDFEAQSGVPVTLNLAGSQTLAQQIDAAPRADVFLSANADWMAHLDGNGRLLDGSRRTFLSNKLVVVAHRESDFVLPSPADLANLDFTHLAIGAPDAVPAGVYAHAWLQSVHSANGTSLWENVQGRVAPAPDVRSVLALVEASRDVVGIVYATDARTSSVRVLHVVEGPLPDPIEYVAAEVKRPERHPQAAAFLTFITGEGARSVFAEAGFIVPAGADGP